MKSETKTCQNCKKDFTIEPDDFLFYEKIKVPAPTFCPECRTIRRLCWRNERNLYKRKCAHPKHSETLISMFSPESNVTTFDSNMWWSDDWDSLETGKTYDFSKPFFEQYKELQKITPRPPLVNNKAINSDYCNFADKNKNCYLVTNSNRCENCAFSNLIADTKDSLDVFWINKSELLYECIDCDYCYQLRYSQQCEACTESSFLYECKGLLNCMFCIGLRNVSNYIFNKPVSKDEYEKKLKELNGSYKKYCEALKEFNKLKLEYFHRANLHIGSKIITGNMIYNSYEIKKGFNVYNSEQCAFVHDGLKGKDCQDVSFFDGAELCYESTSLIGNGYLFTIFCRESHNLIYSDNCHTSSNLFGCVSLRSKQYCILNKQYTKEEYEELIPKIIKHMNDMPYIDSKGRIYKYGEFFPVEFSPFNYNETIAQEYFPLTKEQAIQQGYKWKNKEERNYSIDIHTDDLPDSIKDIPDDDILNKVIECSHKGLCNQQCTEAFKIIPEELSFYRRMNLPLPRLCPNCRHYERLSQRNPMKLWHRSCMKEGCTNTFETSYAPERPEIIYCEKCYQNEVY